MPRPPIPDDVAARDPNLAHAAALRDRLAELPARLDALFAELECRPTTLHGVYLEDTPRTRELFAEIDRLMTEAETIRVNLRAVIGSRQE